MLDLAQYSTLGLAYSQAMGICHMLVPWHCCRCTYSLLVPGWQMHICKQGSIVLLEAAYMGPC